MKTIKTSFVIAALLLAGCSTSQLSISLTVVSDATEAATIAVPTLEASGVLPSGLGNIVLAYTQAVSTAASKSSAELLTNDSAAVKDTKIIGFFSGITVPALGPTVGPEVQALVNAITSAVSLFLTQFSSPTAKKAAVSGAADKLKMSMGERHTIGTLGTKLAATSAKCKTLMK